VFDDSSFATVAFSIKSFFFGAQQQEEEVEQPRPQPIDLLFHTAVITPWKKPRHEDEEEALLFAILL
jgi:hypothetical protein